MRAMVRRRFKGVADGQVYPRWWEPGTVVEGALAVAAVQAGDAEAVGVEKAAAPVQNKARATAPRNKSRGG